LRLSSTPGATLDEGSAEVRHLTKRSVRIRVAVVAAVAVYFSRSTEAPLPSEPTQLQAKSWGEVPP
jgi:hypothetical protein